MHVRLDEKAILAIEEILRRGNDVIIRKKRDCYVVYEERRKTKYTAACLNGDREGL